MNNSGSIAPAGGALQAGAYASAISTSSSESSTAATAMRAGGAGSRGGEASGARRRGEKRRGAPLLRGGGFPSVPRSSRVPAPLAFTCANYL
eukprot:scaffold144056_cov29-Tisochrysis_lutea.AAC.4